MTATAKVTKINKGIYALTLAEGIVVEIEQYPCGLWFTFGVNRYGDRDYMQHYATKRDAISHLLEGRDELIAFFQAEKNHFAK